MLNELIKVKNLKKILKWYNEIELSIELLETFIDNVESQIELSIQDFIDRKETLILTEDPNSYNAQVIDIHNGLDSQTWDLKGVFEEYFPNLQRKSALISLYSFLEFELDKLCILFKNEGNYKIDINDLNGSGIKRAILYLEKVVDLLINQNDRKIGEIKSIQKIRNLIVHNNGYLMDKNGKKYSKELKYIKYNKFLSGEQEINLNKGFLTYVLNSFNDLFKHIDSLIQEKYG